MNSSPGLLPADDMAACPTRAGTLAGAVMASASFSSRDCLADALIPAWYRRLIASGQPDSRFDDGVAH